MDVLQEISAWCKDLPDWQNDAVVRLFGNRSLSADDIEDLYALLKAEHGIPDIKERKPKKLKPGQIATPAKSGTQVELISIKDFVHVNAIAEKQKLSFAPNGLTVIYGDNGSGKSGYTRVLKRACRARDQSESILPNASLHPSKTGNATATFVIRVNGIDQEIKWMDGNTAPELLSTFAIFDHLCARAYLDLEGDFSYVPYGLDIFDGLVKICDALKIKLANEIDQYSPDLELFADLCGPTVVGQIVENLSADTQIAQIEKLGTLSTEEIVQYQCVSKNVNEIDPKGKADQLRIKIRRIKRLIDAIKEKETAADNSKIEHFQKLDTDYIDAQLASQIAADKFKVSGEYLTGTGGNAWRDLFEAARKFSAEAYPGLSFPYIEKEAKCPLCQQSLEDGAERLRKFEFFIQQETEKNSRLCLDALTIAKRDLTVLDMSIGLDEEILEEISQSNIEISKTCQSFQISLYNRYSEILSSFDTHAWSKITSLTESPIEVFNLLLNTFEKEIEILEKLENESARKSLRAQMDEFDSRNKLSQRKRAVISAIEKMQKQAQLRNCQKNLDPTKITIKRHDISQQVITQKLTESLKKEFKNLDVGDLKVIPKSKGTRGKTPYKLILDLPGAKNPGSISKILSEGQQRSIAIASFLAEVGLSNGVAGIVFDDPVSSLDHRRRQVVAKRLVEEAKNRQVIIFTHDIIFLSVLIEESKNADVLVEPYSLVEKPEGFGIPERGNPFVGMKTSDRVKFLRTLCQEIDKIYKSGDIPEFRRRTKEAYSLLRSTWERAVEEVLFDGVVMRFQRGISTQKLRAVTVEDSDYDQIDKGTSKCSNVTEAHDTALAIGISVPKPDELMDDINTLEIWRISVEKRKDEIRKRRK
jgi:energy-coupling factor transporter ATP-binding protein EcfA2